MYDGYFGLPPWALTPTCQITVGLIFKRLLCFHYNILEEKNNVFYKMFAIIFNTLGRCFAQNSTTKKRPQLFKVCRHFPIFSYFYRYFTRSF